MNISSITNYQNYYIKNQNSKSSFNSNLTKCDNSINKISNAYYMPFCGVKNIDFKPAKTIGEAIDFGKRILGIAQYTDFSDESLDVVNYINEGLCLIKNTTRLKPRLPRYIYFEEFGNVQMSSRYFAGGELIVNKNTYDVEELESEISRIFNELKKDEVFFETSDGIFLNNEIVKPDFDEFFNELLKKRDSIDNLSYDEKIDLYNGIRVIYEKTSQLNRFPKDLIIKMLEAGCWGEFDEIDVALFAQEINSVSDDENFITLYKFLKDYKSLEFNIKNNSFKHKTLFHEVGHLQDMDIFYMASMGDYRDSRNYTKEMNAWLNDKEALKAAFEISPYACYGAPEFVAEAYAYLLAGKELPKNAQALYGKLKAPKVVLR
ncbi:MAG: hypothetical protein IJB79_04205 [Candidatus Gastranaerophilales bacterium]|nr:hypothetical protein [Candidatus Gastranaerophilales bacterium]